MLVLVAGAGGYVGGRLVPLLLERGHDVTASFTTAQSAQRFPWADQVRVAVMDVLDREQVLETTRGVDAVVYLVHGMGGADFARKDEQSAHHVAQAALQNGVERIVYLSGIVPPVPEDDLSEHVRSRLQVERILTASGVETMTLRAAIILGSGSTSFEILRQLSERLPVQTVPAWMTAEVQPIGVVDVLELLASCLEVPAATRSYDIGGPQRMPYVQLLDLFAETAGLVRPQVSVPFLPTDLVGWLAGQVTDVPSATVEALVQSLHHDMVCAEEDFRSDLLAVDYRMTDVQEAMSRALRPAEPAEQGADQNSFDPMGPLASDPDWAGGEVFVEDGQPVHAPRTAVAELLLGPRRADSAGD